MKKLSITGTLVVEVGGCCGSPDRDSRVLSLYPSGCCDAGLSYDEAASFSHTVRTAGAVGQVFADIPGLDGYSAIEFLRVFGSARYRLRFNPTQPGLVGIAAIPAGGVVAGAATFTVTDSVGTQYVATVNFAGGTNTPALVMAAINGALAAAGAPAPEDGLWARLSSNIITVVAPGTGPSAFVQLAAGAPADLGLGVALVVNEGTSSDTPDLEGLYIASFPRSPNAPIKVQVSGVASLDITAAGRVTA